MSYAFVEDIAASWEDYDRFVTPLRGDQIPDGLVLHAAGPTDEGIRIVEVWESEQAWTAYLRTCGSRSDDTRPHPPTVRRELRPRHIVVGAVIRGERGEEGATSSRPSGGRT